YLELFLRRAGGDRDPVLESLGHPTYAVPQVAGNYISLNEISLGQVKENGDPLGRHEVHDLGVPPQGLFGDETDLPGDPFFFGVIIDREMCGLKIPPVKGAPLDLVFAETDGLREGFRGKELKEDQAKRAEQASVQH